MSNQEHQCAENQTGEDPEIAGFLENLSRDFDVLPLFERAYNEFIYKRKYSLNNNEKLRSRWHERVMKGKGAGSQELPNINDYHFHNCRNKFMPSQSLANYPSPRLQLAPGPGPDDYGQRPIPDDMLDKQPKLAQQKETVGKKNTKTLKRLLRV